MKKKLAYTFSAILLLFLAHLSGTAQSPGQVSGTVTNISGEGIPDISVTVKGTKNGAVTGAEGNFTLRNVPPKASLVFTGVGFQDQEVALNSRSEIEITLVESVTSLDQVVVVGYGRQSKKTLTGSIVAVQGEVIEKTPSIGLSNSFAGRLPGVIALNRSGEPGENIAQLLIRGKGTLGSTGPLIVIDGVAERKGLDLLNPRDIESVSVLKDASAAIYGSRAANGVILVTTKRGVSGKPVIGYNFNQGLNQPTRIPEYADAATLADFTNEQLIQQGQLPKYSQEDIQKYKDGSDPINFPNTNWRKAALKEFSTQSQQSLSVKGGSKLFRYYTSGNFSNQEGIFKNGITNSKSIGIKVNTDSYITDNIKISLDLSMQEQNNLYPNGSANSTSTSSILESMYRNFPFLVDVYPDGRYGTGFIDNANPLAMAAGLAGSRSNKINIYQTKASFEIKIPQVKGLSLDGYVAYDKNDNFAKLFQKTYFTYKYQPATNTYQKNLAGGITSPQLTERFDFNSSLIFNVRVQYDRTLGDHKINSFVAMEQAEDKSNYFSAFRKNYLTDQIDQIFAGGGSEQVTDGKANEFARKNYFGRVNYGYKGKYLLDFSLRYDGSSAFPKQSRWGLFPAVSGGWVISEEAFFKNPVVNNLKLRASWGQMGNDEIAAFQYLASYSFTPGYVFGQPNLLSGGLVQGVEANPNITWEVANTTNVGLDAQFFDGAVSVTFDAFKSRRTNILAIRNASIPEFTGLRLPLENIGIVDNKGFELSLSYQKSKKELNYSFGGNMSYAQNTIVDIDEPSNVDAWKLQTGHPMNTSLYYITEGIYRTDEEINKTPHVRGTRVGDLRYEDINNDGEIDSRDMKRLDKTNTPEFFFGINASLEYKGFELSILAQGQANAWQYYFIPQGLFGNVLNEMVTNRPTPDNPNSKYPNLSYDEAQVSALQSDFWLRDASYIRLKSIELGKNLPAKFTKKLGLQNARLYLNGFNLITLDKLKWFDPEGNASRGANYPQNKIYNVGLNITL